MASNANEFSIFLEACERDIFSFCKYLTMGKGDADELYQDTVLAAFLAMDKIDITHNPKAYVYSIAVGKWKNATRKAARRNAIAPAINEEALLYVPGSDNVEAAAEAAALKQTLATAIKGIDDKHRIPLILHYFDDCSTEEIANICNIPKGTVKSRLHKGRELLRKDLAKEGYDGT